MGELDRNSARQSMQKNAKAMDSRLASVLTDDQKAKLKEMGGRHFTATEPDFGPGGQVVPAEGAGLVLLPEAAEEVRGGPGGGPGGGEDGPRLRLEGTVDPETGTRTQERAWREPGSPVAI